MRTLQGFLIGLLLVSLFEIDRHIDHDRGAAAVFGALLAGAGCGLWATRQRGVA